MNIKLLSLKPFKHNFLRDDKIFIRALKDFIDKSNFLELKDKILSEINRNIGIFGNLRLKQEIEEINNGSASSLNRSTGTYLRTTYLPESGIEIKDIVKVFKTENEARKVKKTEEVFVDLADSGYLDDIVVTHSYSKGKVLGYLFAGSDLKKKSQDSDVKEKKDLISRLFQTHINFAKSLTKSKKRLNGYIYEDETHMVQFEKSFIRRFGHNGEGLEGLINVYKENIIMPLDNIKSKYVQHADPKMTNAVVDNKDGNIKLIDFEHISDSPIHKLAYMFWDRYNLDLKEIFSMLEKNNFFDSGYNFEAFESDFDVMRNHEDLLSCSRCFEFSKKAKSKTGKYLKYANFYLNRALKNIEDDNLKSEIVNFVQTMSDGSIKNISDKKFSILQDSSLIQDRELSTYLTVDFETYYQKIEEIEKKQKRGRLLKKTLLIFGTIISLGLLGLGLYGGYRYNEQQFLNETYKLNQEWRREHNSLLLSRNPCDILERSADTKNLSDILKVAKGYGSSHLVNRLINKYGIENERVIIDNLPKLLQQQLNVYEMGKYSNVAKVYLDNFNFQRIDTEQMPFFTYQEVNNIHMNFPCCKEKN